MNIEEQKNALLANKESLIEVLSSLGREISESGDWIVVPKREEGHYADPLDDAEVAEELEEDIAILGILESRYEQVNKALEAIEEGNYGICEVCKENIKEERLLVNPSSTTCIAYTK